MEDIRNGIFGEQKSLVISETEAGQRADVGLAALLGTTRSNMQKLLEEGRVVKGAKVLKSNYKLKLGNALTITLPEEESLEPQPEKLPLDIIYEDEDVIVINKARGMVVHPAAGNATGTLVNALLHHCDHLSHLNGEERPGIVHRLDKDTSGIMICAKNDAAHEDLAAQIQSKEAQRTYLAVVRGNLKEDEGVVETLIARAKDDRKKMAVVEEGGRQAITTFKVLERFGKYTLVQCRLQTGRTHQIRVHMEYLGYPVVGDPKYSPRKTPFSIKGQALHSLTLSFRHPRTGEHLEFSAPLPEDMHKIVTRLRLGQFN